MNINNYKYHEICIGDTFYFQRYLSIEDIDNYAKLTGDYNPLHCDEEYAKTTEFNGRIIHGMLASSLFSTLVGMVCPGKKNLYLTQNLNFKRPIYHNSKVTVKGTIKNKIDSIKLISIQTEILIDGVVMIDGEAKVKLME